jgi:glycosyltransferase involved in cell wall biosynthesis
MREWCADVHVAPFHAFKPQRSKAMLAYASRLPRSVIDTQSAEMARLVARAAEHVRPDLVVASQVGMAPYALMVNGASRILEEVELGLMHHQIDIAPNAVGRWRRRMTWLKFTHYVSSLIRQFDAFTVVSDRELRMMSELGMDVSRGHVVSNGVDVRRYGGDFGAPRPNELVYAGALTFQANYDAVGYFLSDIYPLVKAACHAVTFSVTGKHDGVPMQHLRLDPSVRITGYLDDVRPRIAQSWASMVPLRMGGGTRLKILESLALGTPIVATSKGAEGLDLVHGEDILIADRPRDFADAAIRLIGDAPLRARLSERGRRAVAAKYDWASLGRVFCDLAEMQANRKPARLA